MNKEEWVKSYAKGFQPPSSKKQGMMQQWLPIVAIILVAFVGVWMYTTVQSDRKVNTAAFQDILNRLNAISR
jgi:CHASE1-domain containing sensor protein